MEGREGGETFCSAALPHRPSFTQASGPQFNREAGSAPAEGGPWVQLKTRKWVIKLVHLVLFHRSQKPIKTLS